MRICTLQSFKKGSFPLISNTSSPNTSSFAWIDFNRSQCLSVSFKRCKHSQRAGELVLRLVKKNLKKEATFLYSSSSGFSAELRIEEEKALRANVRLFDVAGVQIYGRIHLKETGKSGDESLVV